MQKTMQVSLISVSNGDDFSLQVPMSVIDGHLGSFHGPFLHPFAGSYHLENWMNF